MRQQHPEMYDRLQKGELVLPVVFVDSTEVSQGYLDYFSISRALKNARKVAEARSQVEAQNS